HDQDEAMAMSDRIAVMNAGRIEQFGTPATIYGRPRTRFVAEFIGEINLFAGNFAHGAFCLDDGRILPANAAGRTGRGSIAVRPERMRFAENPEAVFTGHIETANYLGDHILFRVATQAGAKLLIKQTTGGRAVPALGARVGLAWSSADA